jgi:hypothetical protein
MTAPRPAGPAPRESRILPRSGAAMSEAELDRAIGRILKDLPQLTAYHTYDSRKSACGWPDLVIARVHVHGYDGGAVMFRELKREDGKVKPAQETWLEALAWAGLDTGVWRPAQLLDGTIARELAALAGLRVAGGAGDQ